MDLVHKKECMMISELPVHSVNLVATRMRVASMWTPCSILEGSTYSEMLIFCVWTMIPWGSEQFSGQLSLECIF